MPRLYEPAGCVLHHADALALGPDPGEYVGIVRLGDRQVKVSVELLGRRIVMGVDHSCVCRIADRISVLHGLRREDHVLIEDRLPDKSPQLHIDLPLICRTDIGTEVRLDSKRVEIREPLYPAFVRIVELSRVALDDIAVLCGKLSRICHGDILLCKSASVRAFKSPVSAGSAS